MHCRIVKPYAWEAVSVAVSSEEVVHKVVAVVVVVVFVVGEHSANSASYSSFNSSKLGPRSCRKDPTPSISTVKLPHRPPTLLYPFFSSTVISAVGTWDAIRAAVAKPPTPAPTMTIRGCWSDEDERGEPILRRLSLTTLLSLQLDTAASVLVLTLTENASD